MLLLVLLLAVSVFAYIQHELLTQMRSQTETVAGAKPQTTTDEVDFSSHSAPAEESESPQKANEESITPNEGSDVPSTPVLAEPIPLSQLPLTETQKDLLRSAGIDPATFIITPAMVTCAQSRLGEQRFAEIIAGNTPGPTEVFSLLRCL